MYLKSQFPRKDILLFGITSAIYGFFSQLIIGYNSAIPITWILSISSVGLYFFIRSPKIKWPVQLEKADIIFPIILLIIFAPIYLLFLYQIPYQINTDEIALTGITKEAYYTPNLLGLSGYLNYPSLIYVVFRFLQGFLGGVNIENMRTIHAMSGLTIIIVSYFFFKLFRPSLFAFTASLLLGSQHTFLAVSRMALRDNVSVLIELLALIFLIKGLKKKSAPHLYIGGIVAGLSVYAYINSTAVIILWFAFLTVAAIFFRKKFKWSDISKSFLISLLGIILVVQPFLAANLKLPPDTPSYYKNQLLIYKEGRQEQRMYAPEAKDEVDGVKTNLTRTLTVFNNNLADHGHIYQNPGHGFVDPLTGIFVWIGLILILLKRKKELSGIFIATGFLTLMIIFSLIVNKSPHYDRMLVIIPFVIFLTVEAISRVSNISSQLGKYLFLSITLIIILWNLLIYSDFLKIGFKNGEVVGGTTRYVEGKKNIANHTFLIATDEKSHYFNFYDNWISPHQEKSQSVIVLNPQKLQDVSLKSSFSGNFTIFLNSDVWEKAKINLINTYPNLIIHNMMPNGSKIAIEVN